MTRGMYIGLSLAVGISLVLSGCSDSGSSDIPVAGTITVTAVDGYIKDAYLTDNGGKVGTYSSNGRYSFSGSIAYPLTLTSGELEDTNASFDINMTAQEGALVISPITTFLENNSTLLGKLANLGLGVSTLSDYSVDYVDTNNRSLAQLAQLLYMVQKDATLLNAFKTSLASANPVSLNELFTLAEADVNTTMGIGYPPIYRAFLDKVKSLTVPVSTFESELEEYKLNMNTSLIVYNGVAYGTVTSLYTSKVWLDRNLGASQVCTALDDTACYGDYYQWGRNYDGHQVSTSDTNITLATDISNAGTDFITSSGSPDDWTVADDNGSLRNASWSATDGSSVCPVGFRVPTITELKAETTLASTAVANNTDAFNNFLKLPSAGSRGFNGFMSGQGSNGNVWSSSAPSLFSNYLELDSSSAVTKDDSRAYGYSVRCLKD